jgi:hypothetical protein
MIDRITDRLRAKVIGKVKEEHFLTSPRLGEYKEQTWKGYKASGVEQDMKEPYMGEDDHYSRKQQSFETIDSEQQKDEYEDEFHYGLEGDFTSSNRKKISNIKKMKGRGLLISFYEHNEEAAKHPHPLPHQNLHSHS